MVKRTTYLPLQLGVALAFGLTCRLANAAPKPPELVELSLEQLMTIEVDNVQTASKYSQRVTEAPSSVSIVTADEISRFGARTLSDVLRMVRGFYPTYDRSYNYSGIRGFGRPSDFDSRILIMVDGHRINDGVYDYGASGTDFIVDVASIERVEVIRGPGSSLYGTNAFFAVVNVITKKGSDVKAAAMSAEYGSLDTRRARISVGSEVTEDLHFYLSGTAYESNGGRNLYFSEFDDSSTNDGIAANGDGDNFENLLFNATWGKVVLESAYVNRNKHYPTGAYGTIFGDPSSRTRDRKSFVALKYSDALSDMVDLELTAGYDWYQYQGFYPFAAEDEEQPAARSFNEDRTHAERLGTEMMLTVKFSDAHRLLAGTEYRDDFRLNQQNFDATSGEMFLNSDADQQVWAAYLQDEYRLADNLSVLAGIRHDDYSTFGSTTNPRGAVVFNPAENSALKLLYGAAFRAPNGFELFYSDFAGSYERNPDLKAEEIDTYELVLEHYFNAQAHGAVSFFYYEISGLINQVINQDTGKFVSRNSDNVTAHGVEFELDGQWPSGVLTRASYAFVETEDGFSGKQLSNSPRHVAKGLFSFPLLKDRLYLSPALHIVSRRTGVQGHEIPFYALVNATLRYRTPVDGLQASFSIYNLFDRDFFDPVGAEIGLDRVQQDGRLARFELEYRYDLTR